MVKIKMKNKNQWILSNALRIFTGWSRKEKQLLLEHLPQPFEYFSLSLFETEKLCHRLKIKYIAPAEIYDAVSKIVEICDKKKIYVLTYDDSLYPQSLKEISNPPDTLYLRSSEANSNNSFDNNSRFSRVKFHLKNTLVDHSNNLAIVGTRKAHPEIMDATRKLSEAATEAGLNVISGLAKGIDVYSHVGCLDYHKKTHSNKTITPSKGEYKAGQTVAVLGTAIDEIYPRCHLALAERMMEQGHLILSEYGPGVPGRNWYFPLRNRIISGLSQGVLMTQAGKRSGALITVKYALEQDRDVYTLPCKLFAQLPKESLAGNENLLRQGAISVHSINDLLRLFNRKKINFSLSSRDRILDLLSRKHLSPDELAHQLNLSLGKVMAKVSSLILQGKVIQGQGNQLYINHFS